MTVDQLIRVLQRVPDKSALVTFSYDSRVCVPSVTCVDYVPDAPAVVLRSEDIGDWEFHRGDDDAYKNDVNLYLEDR